MALEELEIENGLLVKYRGAGGHVAIPDGVVAIRENAFGECGPLESVTLPASLRTIGEFAFNNCDALEEVRVPTWENWLALDFQGFRSNPLSNGAQLIVNGQPAVHVVLPEGASCLGSRAFEGCTSLESIAFPRSLRKVGKLALASCPNLREITANVGLAEIGYSAFRNNAALASFTFPTSLKKICSWAFAQCTALSSIVLPDGLETLERDAFYGCSAAGFVRLPATLHALPDDAFYGCAALDAVCIPAGVNAFGSNVFTRCSAIREVQVEGAFLPEAFVPPTSMEVLVAPALEFSVQLRPSLQLPLAAGFVKLAAEQHVPLAGACAAFAADHVDDILQALRFQPTAVKWLVDEGFISQQECAAYAAAASSYGQTEAAALLLEESLSPGALEGGASNGSGAFDPFDLEL